MAKYNTAQQCAAGLFEDLANDDHKHTWEVIVEYIEGEGHKVKDWRSIRSVLQDFINAGHIKRTDNIFTEEYESAVDDY